jgi:hypothetical protein
MSEKKLVLNDTEIIKSTSFVPYLTNSKIFKKYIKFDVQKYFNINIMLNGLDQSFELSNSIYRYETRTI